MGYTAGQLIGFLEQQYDPALQAQWDNSGLQVGDRQAQVSKVLLSLDVTGEVIEYAVSERHNFILSHHPLLFAALKSIDVRTGTGNVLARALANAITIYSLHTNLDVAPGGVSHQLARVLELADVAVLDPLPGKYLKLAVFVPEDYVDAVRKALGDAGAGWIGNYSHCTFAAAGTGSFLPGEGTNPHIGRQGKLELVAEQRLETLVPRSRLRQVLAAMEQAHPYEEIAFDVIPLENPGRSGFGCVGDLPQPMAWPTFLKFCAERLGTQVLRATPPAGELVGRVAVCGGRGGHLAAKAVAAGAQALVTGDVDHHQVLAAKEQGLALIDAGHRPTEQVVLPVLAEKLKQQFAGLTVDLYQNGLDAEYFCTSE